MENIFTAGSWLIVLIITLLCWSGFFFYMMKTDKKLDELEKK